MPRTSSRSLASRSITIGVGFAQHRRCGRHALQLAIRSKKPPWKAGIGAELSQPRHGSGIAAHRDEVKLLAVKRYEMPLHRPRTSPDAFSTIASNTGARSPGELLMTCNTSAVAVCCSNAPRASCPLGDQPRILHRDHRLRGEILQQRDLFIGERAHLLAKGHHRPNRSASLRSGTKSAVRNAVLGAGCARGSSGRSQLPIRTYREFERLVRRRAGARAKSGWGLERPGAAAPPRGPRPRAPQRREICSS